MQHLLTLLLNTNELKLLIETAVTISIFLQRTALTFKYPLFLTHFRSYNFCGKVSSHIHLRTIAFSFVVSFPNKTRHPSTSPTAPVNMTSSLPIKKGLGHAVQTKRPSKHGHMLTQNKGEAEVIVLIYTILHVYVCVFFFPLVKSGVWGALMQFQLHISQRECLW